jgi:peptidoglycan-associated lipoprotein
MSPITKLTSRGAVALALLATVAGCATVKQDEFRAEMDAVRADMAAGDEALDARITTNATAISDVEMRLDRVEADLQQLATDFDATVQRLETALRFTAPVHFGFDDATVRNQDHELLQRFSSVVGEHYPDALITVEGFTDPSGSAAYNLRLGQRRADAVKAFLTDQGRLSAPQIRAVSYGEDTSRLVDANAMGPGETGIANRRVVLVIEHANAASRPAVVTDASTGAGSQ